MAEVSLLGFATTTFTKVVTFAADNAINKIKLACVVKSELGKLTNSMKAICAFLKDAERKQSTSGSHKLWLENLQDVVYDIDDVLDDVGTRALQQKVEKGSISTFFAQLFIFPFQLGRKIKKVRERLDEIAAIRSNFTLTEEPIDTPIDENVQTDTYTPIDENVQTDTYSIVDERNIIGRERAKNDIVKMILEAAESNSDTLSVLPLTGMGGIGKTALAKLVFNDKRTNKKFDKILWACLSNMFDLRHILDIIIQSDSGESYKHLSLEALQKKLYELLRDKRYLLVLDDMSNDHVNKWEDLINLLPSGGSGSMILITTRSRKLASIVKTMEPYEVAELPPEECMQVFVQS